MDNLEVSSASTDFSGRGLLKETSENRLKSPKSLITSPTVARVFYNQYRQDHFKRIKLCAAIEGLIAGNPPYDPNELKRLKLEHIANFNNLDARSLYERSVLAYWNLLNEAESLVKFTIRKNPTTIVDVDLPMWADIMAANLTKVLRSWQGFITQSCTLSGQLIKFGVSPVIWPDEQDWRWRTIEYPRFFVQDQALSDMDQLTCVCIETTFTAQYLYSVYEMYEDLSPEERKDFPWNIEELVWLLIRRANAVTKPNQFTDMMQLQRHMQNLDVGWENIFTDNIRLISMLSKEYTGEITHLMFDPIEDKKNEFLFKAPNAYKELTEAMVLFTYSPGEFTIHSNRGVGHKIFAGCQAVMQLDCSMINMGQWASTPIIRTNAVAGRDFAPIRFYPGVPTDIGAAEYVENRIGMNIDQLIGASQYMMSKIQYNTAISGDDPSAPDKDLGSKAPAQVRVDSVKEFGVLKNNVAMFYNNMDVLYRNVVAKMLHSKPNYAGYEYAKEWKERCLEDGVPEEILKSGPDQNKLPRHLEVSATRVAGDGSNVARIIGLEALAPFASGFSAKGKRAYQQEVVIAHCGRDYIDKFLPQDSPDEIAGGASLAQLENYAMLNGQSPLFSPENPHEAHVAVHFAQMKNIIDMLQQGQMNPIEADRFFTVCIPHTGEHIQILVPDPLAQQFLQEIKKPWGDFQRFAELNRKNARAQMQAEIKRREEDQQKQQQVMSDEQRKDFQAQKDEERKDLKVQSQVERAKEANQTRGDVARQKIELDAENQARKIELEAQNNRKKTDAQITLEGQSTDEIRSDIRAMNGVTPAPNDFK